MNAREIKYIQKALVSYREIRHGQFDQKTSHKVEETQDGAAAIEYLLKIAEERRRAFQNLICLLAREGFKIPDYDEAFYKKMNASDI